MRSKVVFAILVGVATLAQSQVLAQKAPPPTANLILDGTTTSLSGIHRYGNVCLINGATLNVTSYDGNTKVGTGNLELIAGSIYVDPTSKIVARGTGYQPALCSDGRGPNDTAGGRGGCSVMDSGGGGAHFGRGGRGTVDDPETGDGADAIWQSGFPSAFEDDCDIDFIPATATCAINDTNRTLCWRGWTDRPTADPSTCPLADQPCVGATVAGSPYWHNIYSPEFGAAGGDKGCRDNDGRTDVAPMAGAGGGRVVLVGLADRNPGNPVLMPAIPAACAAAFSGGSQGKVRVEGTIDANGKRGCGRGNDSGGGGGGGSVLIVGQQVTVGTAAVIRAAGGLGGDTNASGSPEGSDCGAGAQAPGGECDDCGGGGGGGIISVLSVTSSLDAGAAFNVSGALGGVCTVCNGEAGGGAGELQLDGAYVGEYCDGFDNDFDGAVDEELGTQTCGLGACAQDIAACENNAPKSCMPMVNPSDASCSASADNARPRIAVILDTSASMLLDLAGYPTFGDGSADRPGIASLNGIPADGMANDSRLYLAREALAQVMSAYPEIEFALARYHQDQGVNRSCQNAKWFECQGLVGTYDNPNGNTGSQVCSVSIGPNMGNTLNVNAIPGPVGSQCINYAGSCGPPRRGADVLSGFGSKVRDMVRWLDGVEQNSNPADALSRITIGDVCQHSNGTNNCEVRGSGPTPLAGSLQALEDYVVPIRLTDSDAACRGYSIILLTDGAESCNGDPVDAAQRLHDVYDVEVFVIAVSVLATEVEGLNRIARAGSGNARDAVKVDQPDQLITALTGIIAGSIRFEKCDGMDNDCDGNIDEDFPDIGSPCDDGERGVCKGEGTFGCNAAQDGTECKYTNTGATATDEVCNMMDDDCDDKIDEGLSCGDIPCTNTGEVCNALDDDCDGKVDETFEGQEQECGPRDGICVPGRQRCVAGKVVCLGGVQPMMEVCNGKDDDCDGEIDEEAPCPAGNMCIEGACRRECSQSVEFPCPVGYLCSPAPNGQGFFCLPGACAVCKSTEVCENDACKDPCTDVDCADNETCVLGTCKDCTQLGCPSGQVCYDRSCQEDACRDVECGEREFCFNGECRPLCVESECDSGERCNASGECERDRCAGVVCDDGQLCRDGRCQTDSCVELECGLAEICVSEQGCIPDPCGLTTCPPGLTCQISEEGQSVCVGRSKPAPKPERYVSGGGSGGFSSCSVTTLRGSGLPLSAAWLLVPALVWSLRRRRARTTSQSTRGA